MALIVGISVSILLVFRLLSNRESTFELAGIENYLGVQIPKDATGIDVNSQTGYKPYFRLSFKASAESMSEFAKEICEGELHQGYDPFHAVDTAQVPPKRPYLIKMQSFTYYSYSPDAPDTMWSNRCWPFRKGLLQIVVDKQNPSQYEFTLEMPENCEKVAACSPIGNNYIEPIHDLPLIVIGMAERDGKYVLVSDEVCFETQLSYVLSSGWTQVEKWKNLVDAQVSVTLDDKPLNNAYISHDGRLTQNGSTPDSFRYDYCFTEDWSAGMHNIRLQLQTNGGEYQEYSWKFLAE
jgi:hypothetical protein